MKVTKAQLREIVKEELAAVFEEADRTAKGNVTQDARDDHATLSDGRFPIFDKKSALAALKLRGHGTTASERKKIINKAAKYAPDAAKKAREADKEN